MSANVQEMTQFLGVNLRKERLDLADIEVAKAINADFHSHPGSIVLRAGRTKLNTSALTDLQIRTMARINSKRYQASGTTLYRDQVSFLTGLSANKITKLAPFRPLNDPTLWAFIADDAVMDKDDGTNTYRWGIAAPSATPAGSNVGGGSLSAGAYYFLFTYCRKNGSSLCMESNPSPVSLVVNASASDKINVTGMSASADPQVTHKRIYRTTAGGAVYLFDQEITNATTTATLTIADTALGAQVEIDNGLPPTASFVFEHQGHMMLCRDASNLNYLWFSKRYRPECYPTTNYVEIGTPDDPLQAGVTIGGSAGVFSRRTKYRILGNSVSGFVPLEALSRRGTLSPMSCIATPYGATFVARDGFFITNFMNPDENLSEDILPLFFGETVNDMAPINWDYASTMSCEFYKNKIYWTYPSGSSTTPDTMAVYSNDTKKWYFYDHPMRSLYYEEDTDYLLGGGLDGFIYLLENGTSDAGSSIALDIETKDYFGESAVAGKKLFRYFKVDADCDGGTLTAKFYVDDSLKQTSSITGSRTRVLNPLPQASMGTSWMVRITYTGTNKPKIYGISAISIPMATN